MPGRISRTIQMAAAGGKLYQYYDGNARIDEVTASQASMVSQPEAVTQLILSAVEETSRSRAWGYDSRAMLSARLKALLCEVACLAQTV